MNKKRAQQIFNALNKASKQSLQKKKFSFSYKSDFLEYKSYLSNFSTDQYQLFDALFDELEIQDSIRSLLNGAIVNKTENRPALLTYTVAGDNTKKKSLEILKSISQYADICELGFPHNTPIADGGQIQTSAYRAIKNGIKINDVFSIARSFKKSKGL